MKQIYNKKEIQEKLKEALKQLKINEQKLLDNNTNERSITHHLAKYLEIHFHGWDVDCEYNRIFKDPKKLYIISQALTDCKDEDIKPDDISAKTVYPDIIVHKRDSEENLLVIEVKKTRDEKKDYKYDLIKLDQYKQQLKYKFAVHILLDDIDQYISEIDSLYFA